MTLPPGTVVGRSGYAPRFHLAEWCWDDLVLPAGTLKFRQAGLEVSRVLNIALERMTGEWFATIDDDHTFAPTLITRLVERMLTNDLDIVVPLVTRKEPPYTTVAYGFPEGTGARPLPQADLSGPPRLVQVYAAGLACMVVQRRVFEQMDKPYFRVGQHVADQYQEDLDFCGRANAAGFKVWCDTSTCIGHISQVTVWPHLFPDGERGVFLALGQETVLPIRPRELAVGVAVGVR